MILPNLWRIDMTVKEAAQKWNLSANTVSAYCRKGVAFGPNIRCKKKKNVWIIPEDSARPYLPSVKKPAAANGCYRHILTAMDSERYLSAATLGISDSRYRKYFDEITATGHVKPIDENAAYNTAKYYLTIDGSRWKKEAYPSAGKRAKDAFDGYVEMVIKAIAEAAANRDQD